MNRGADSLPFVDLKGQYLRLKSEIDGRIHRVLDHGQFIMGPEVAELEAGLAAFVGSKHCIGVSDGTTALLIAMMALGIKPGDEVITTPFTFIATGEMISLLGATPVFVDIDPLTYNLDVSLLEAAITSRTKLLLPVSLYGQCSDMDAINAVAARHGLAVIEDAAQSFGATYKGRRSCNLSTIACTSFFPSKPLGCYGDGGACFTDDDVLASRMAQIRVHGQQQRYLHTSLGLNGRLDTLQAAVLLAKLPTFGEEVRQRQVAADGYASRLAAIGLAPPFISKFNTSVYAQYTVRVPERSAVVRYLAAAGVPTAVHYPVPLHRQPVYAPTMGSKMFPAAEAAAESVVSLPMYAGITPEVQDRIVEALEAALSQVAEREVDVEK